MTDFLLELRSEEIPARMQDRAREDLAKLFTAEIAKSGLTASEIVTYATPRRLTLIARGLPVETAAVSEETKGPKASAPPQALQGFLRKTGLTREQLVERDGVLFAVVDKPGRATTAVLAEAIPAIIRAFPWPKAMRWGASSATMESLRWVRPLQGIVALFGEDVVPVEIAGVQAGAATVGHRFHHPGVITIGSADDYVEKLRACHVIVDQAERRQIIALGATMAARKAGLELVQDEGLLTENAGLTEWPVPLLGRFDEAFLSVPPEVIQLTARVNQKYFVCRGADGALANAFVCTANIDAVDGGAKIVEGNRKVLAARLSDAKFFYETDLKVPLEEQAAKLDRIVFHEKLGTVADKVARVAKLARWLVEEGIVSSPSPRSRGEGRGEGESQAPSSDPASLPTSLRSATLSPEGERETLAALAYRAALLCKADLVTGMVGEFPELQGLMGGYYAAAQGEDPRVAAAIRDHYKPVGQGDDVPTDPVTVAVSLADKLDTLIGFFSVNEKPTGSKDPFALRRAALAVLAIELKVGLRMPLANVIGTWRSVALEVHSRPAGLETFYARGSFGLPFSDDEDRVIENGFWRLFHTVRKTAPDWPEKFAGLSDWLVVLKATKTATSWDAALSRAALKIRGDAALIDEIIEFFADRLKVQQREAGVRHDLIDAVFALGGEDDLVRLLARVHALQAFIGTEDGVNLLAGYKRAANILKKEGWEQTTRHPGLVPGSTAPLPTAAQEEGWTPAQGRGDEFALSYTPEPAEAALALALDSAEPAAAAAIAREDFEAAMAALAILRAPIDRFFDEGVIVNDSDPEKRAARLALLDRVRAAVHNVADFSKIEG